MYTIIIITVLLVAIRAYFLIKDDWMDWQDVLGLSILNFLLSLIFSFHVAWIIPTHTQIEKSTFELESLQDGDRINTQFFLGSGYVNEQMKYSFYILEQNGYKLYSIDANDAHVKYTDEKPKLEVFKEVINDDFINNFSIALDLKASYIIYVPKGSILQNYTLDAQ
ncbi:hypothetical protein [Flavobacterium phage V157]|nr:hypothetical protein [Flavobacterium phage V175]ASD52778.1 hypothetical protein [Flavobacterium phage V156]ASD52856.1 hypothetical protein [Flavobacterium phage V157]ASD52935.1 hypothetical protein [Flavobacterium phage V165]ASD53014.1 hypothetical protein [Flavobacterium phage V182]QCW20952.1 hypothetical protein [Flavobacterium phage FCOV-F2]QCW21028.1 hypothetical protein [Flavobacterium phage FCOV-F6]QCW21104.1 hypothetical protein [Flavobacterium phage FCOV-F9]QCW21328.1 hypothetica